MKIQSVLKKGLTHKRHKRYQDAMACFQKILTIQDKHLDANTQMGECLRKAGRLNDAHKYFAKVLAINPDYPPVHAYLASLFLQKKQPDQALFHAKKAEDHFNNDLQFLYHYGLILFVLNKLHMAANQFTKVLKIDSNHYGAIINLSLTKILIGEIKNAEAMLLNLNKADPGNYDTLINLGFCNEQQGQIEQAIDYYKKAGLTNNKNKLNAYSGQLYLHHYQWDISPETLYNVHCQFLEQLEKTNVCHFNIKDYSSQAKINIGYISPDFRNHPVGFFIHPIIKNHDKTLFNIFCYSTTVQNDGMTQKIKETVYKWVDIRSLSHDAICQAIQKDCIHILVDLAGHTTNNFIGIFAMKPAPVQVSYLGYPGTTGIPQIDYRITDQWADPPGAGKYYTEKLVRMPNCFLCYQPESQAPPVGDLPANRSGWISFGSFNRIPKLNDNILEIWAQILKRMDKSRLFLKTKTFNDPAVQKKIKHFFENKGIETNRLILLGHSLTREQHLRMYNQMDIALDPYPYHGTTTTCEALWMGVPIITLEGKAHVSRASVSILQNIGLHDCIAKTPEDYINKAIQMGSDISFLGLLRQQLRSIVGSSPLCQLQKYISNLERMYQWMWNEYTKN
jgi:predicted O-linked N-acetylglucosamine transferase (SPINDLY family)